MKYLFLSIQLVIACGVMLAGCDRKPSPESTATAQTTQPSTLPTTRPSSCAMTIDGKQTPFPGARLQIEKDGDDWTATFFSDDPAEAIRPDYQGNSFYLSMQLTGVEDGKLTKAMWALQSPEQTLGDSPEGIFINGQHEQLRPLNATATFEDRGEVVVVKLSGEFQAMQKSEPGTPTRKKVEATIEASRGKK